MSEIPPSCGEILVAGPWPYSPPAGGRPTPLTLPSHWALDQVRVLTPAADFFGNRILLNAVCAALLPWAPAPLDVPFVRDTASGLEPDRACGPVPAIAPDPGRDRDLDEVLAEAAIRAAAGGQARVLVVLGNSPWSHPLTYAVIRRACAPQSAALAAAAHPAGGPPHTGSCALSVFNLTGPPGCEVRPSDVPLDRFAAIMRRLLGPEGCPWDREQSHDTLRPYLIEEAAEVLEAIERREAHTLCDELGDLLLQIAFHAALAEGRGSFGLEDVVEAISGKMVHRHPHVFAGWTVSGSAEVLSNWATIKQAEAEVAGGNESGGAWRELRKQAVRVALAAFEAAFAAARRDDVRWGKAEADLVRSTAKLSGDGARILGGEASPR